MTNLEHKRDEYPNDLFQINNTYGFFRNCAFQFHLSTCCPPVYNTGYRCIVLERSEVQVPIV